MSEAEEKFMNDRQRMERAITQFYASCQAIDIDNEGFMEDVNAGVLEASGLSFEEWVE